MSRAEKGFGTVFAPPERAEAGQLEQQAQAAIHSPLLEWVLVHVHGLLAVVNEQRQIVVVNDALLGELGIADSGEAFGLRPGEALGCVHARDMEAGCGTGRACSSCGAVLAILGCQRTAGAEERTCALTVSRGGHERDLCLRVRAMPLPVGAWRFVLLFLEDITAAQWRGALVRTFFQEFGDLTARLAEVSRPAAAPAPGGGGEDSRRREALIELISREVDVQRALAPGSQSGYALRPRAVPLEEVVEELRTRFASHPAAAEKSLAVEACGPPGAVVVADFPLLVRVLTNMLVNACEGTSPGGEVRLGVASEPGSVTFSLWNEEVVPAQARLRLFQRHFSTKPEEGRGLGSYAVRLFGERFLGGRVSFTSAAGEGTTFSLRLPDGSREN